MKLFLLLLFCHVSFAVKHSLRFVFTTSSEVQTFPAVIAVVQVNEVEVIYCDSNTKTAEPKQDWMEELIEDDPQHLKQYTEQCVAYEQTFRDQFANIKQHLNQTAGVHVLQRQSGCEWDDETDEATPFRLYGYDGEDFLEFDMKSDTWIARTPKAVITKHEWDESTDHNRLWKNYHTNICPQWLKRYLNYGNSSLQRTELPSVSLLQKTPSSPVSCHTTGFYPDRAVLFWRKDGEEIHENVDHGEILPNHDGTFQMSADLNLSSVTPEDWRRYDCVFQLSGVKDDIVTRLDKAVIRTNWEEPSDVIVPVTAAVVVLVLIFIAATGFIVYRRNKAKRPQSSPDSSCELSERLNPDQSDKHTQ